MNADERLTDYRVRAARHAEWVDARQWDESRQWLGNEPSPGFTERLAPYDPNPQYFARESGEGLGDVSAADDLSDIHGYHAIVKAVCVTVCIGWWVYVIFAIGYMVGGRYA